jgi:hypothetical protein
MRGVVEIIETAHQLAAVKHNKFPEVIALELGAPGVERRDLDGKRVCSGFRHRVG